MTRRAWVRAGLLLLGVAGLAVTVRALTFTTQTWDFPNNISQYQISDANRLELVNAGNPATTPVARLKQVTYTHSESGSAPAFSGTMTGVQYDTEFPGLRLIPSSGATGELSGVPGAVGLWHLNSTLNDVAGTDNTLVAPANPADPAAVTTSGKWGTGTYQFTASTNDYLSAPTSAELEPTAQVTVETWVKFTSLAGQQGLVTKYANASGALKPAYALVKTSDTDPTYPNRFQFLTGNTTTTLTVTGTTVITAGVWYHVAGTYTGAQATLYVNGLQDALPVSGALTLSYNYASHPFRDFYTGGWGSNSTTPQSDGYGFTPLVNGTVTELCNYNVLVSATKSLRLYQSSGGVQLASAVSTAPLNTWTCIAIAPVALTAGASYVMSVDSPSFTWWSDASLPSVPQTVSSGTLRIDQGRWGPFGVMPSNSTFQQIRGTPDIGWIPSTSNETLVFGRYSTAVGGPYASLDGYLDEVLVSNQALSAATIRTHGGYTFATVGGGTYVSAVMDSTAITFPVNRWRSLTWGEGPVASLGDEFTPNLMTLRPDDLWHFNEGTGQTSINTAIVPATMTPMQTVNPPNQLFTNISTFYIQAGYGFTTPSGGRTVQKLGGIWPNCPLCGSNTRRVLLYNAAGTKLAYADVTSTGTWAYAGMKDPMTNADLPTVALAGSTAYVVATVTSAASNLQRVVRAPLSGFPFSAGGVTITDERLSVSSGVYSEAMPAVNTAGFIYGIPDVQFTTAAGNSSGDAVLGSSSSVEAIDPSWTAAGRFGKALFFTSTDNDRAQATPTHVTAQDNWTIEAWVYWDGTGSGTNGASLVFNGSSDGLRGYGLWRGTLAQNTNVISVSYGLGAARTFFSTGVPYDLSAWNHIAVIRRNGWLEVYKNGIRIGPDVSPADGVIDDLDAASVPAAPLISDAIIFGNLGNTAAFGGALDEVAVYASALSASTIQSDYRQGAARLTLQMRTGPTLTPDASWTEWRPASFLPSMAAPLPIAPDRFGLAALYHLNAITLFMDDATGGTNAVANTGALPAAGNRPGLIAGQAGFSSAASFDGNDYIAVTSTGELALTSSGIAVECWVKPTAFNATNYLIDKNSAYSLYLASGVPTFNVMSGAAVAAASAPLSVNAWHHVMGTYDTGRINLYVDGALVSAQIGSVVTVTPGAAALYVGARDNIGSNGFQGIMDEVAVYTRVPSDAPFVQAVQALGSNPGLQGFLDNNTYAQFRADFLTSDAALSPQLSSVSVAANTYPTDKPWIRNLAAGLAPDYNALQTFIETPGPLANNVPATSGTISYQITNDATGTTWYYFNGTAWVTAATSAQANPASVVDANLSLFPVQVGMGQLFWKAYFSSNGDQQVVLDKLETQTATASLSLTPPGTPWYLGTTNPVTWTASGLNDVKLEYDNDGSGAFTTTITASTPAASGTFDWLVPQSFALVSAPGAARVRISALDQYGTHLTDTKSGYTVSAPIFTITVPGTQFAVQATQRITWSTVGAPVGNSLKLEYVKGGASGTATQIANVQNGLNNCTVNPPAGGGCYDWFVPNPAVGPQVRIRLTDNGQPLTTGDSADFKVTGSLTVAAPDATTVWTVGQSHDINWTTKGTIPKVIVKYNGTVISGGPVNNTGTFNWTTSTPADASASGVFRVEDEGDNTVFGDSPAIRVTTMAVTSPIATSRWLAGSDQAITWTHTGLNFVRLSYAVGGGADTEIVPSVPASPSAYTWTIPLTAVKRNGVTVRVQDAEQSQTEFQAVATSAPFTVHGALDWAQPPMSPDWTLTCTSGTGDACTLMWNATGSIGQVDLAYSFDGNNFAPITAGLANTGSYDWIPSITAASIRVRVRDSQDSQTESVSGQFKINGIGISAPVHDLNNVPPTWDVGTPQTIAWSKTGSFDYVDLAYTTDGTNWITIIMHRLTNDTDSMSWLVPDAISTAARVRVSQNGNPALSAISDTFNIRGVLHVTGPNGGQTLTVGGATSIQWDATGTMPKVKLELSTNGGSTWPTVIATLATALGSGTSPVANTYAWTVPDAITAQGRVRVSDNDLPAHPAVSDASDGNFTIQGTFAITDPPASTSNGWGVFELKPITWTTTGTVGRVTVEYTTDGAAWVPVLDELGTPATNILNLGSFVWKVPDLVAAALAPADLGKGNVSHKVPTVQVRVRDVDASHAAAARGQQSTAAFTVKWFRVKWVVKNGDTGFEIGEINVLENNSPPVPNWVVDNLTCAAGFDPCLNSPVYRHYPYGGYVTKWLKKDFNPNTITGWTASRDASAGQAGADEWDKVNPVSLASAMPDPTVYNVRLEPLYDQGTDTMTFKTWLEKQGQLPADPTLFGPATLQIYEPDGITLKQSLTANPPIDGATGLPRADWQKNYDFSLSPTNLTPGTIYFAKASITYEGRTRTSGGIANVLIPSNAAVTLADLQNELNPIGTQVGEIHTETVGPASTLQTIVSNQTAIRADIATAKTDLQTDVAGVAGQVGVLQGTADAIKADTGLISTQVLPGLTSIESKVDGVQAYLSSPADGLPKIIANTDSLAGAAKAARRGAILNRDMELEEGETATLQYRSEGGVPTLIIYNAAGGVVAGVPPLALNPATGLYESVISLAALGEYRAVVTEPASADSAGTVDSVTLTMRKSLATNENLYNSVVYLAGRFDAVDTQLVALDAQVDALAAAAAVIQATTDATKLQADSIKADATTLLTKWGALDAAALMTGIDGLAVDLGAVRAKTDTINWADVTQIMADTGNIAAIKTKTDSINWNDVTGLVTTAGAIQAKTDTINWADVAAVKTATDTINWADVTGIKTKTDTMDWADVLGVKAKTDTINWAEVTGIKTATDTINWADVTGVKLKTDTINWADVLAARGDIATVLGEIGAGNIAAIKTKTDSINWADVTGLVTTAGAIQAKTDTIDWADVAGIKTATDTINWADVSGIKLKTDTIDWANVATLLSEIGTGNIAAMKTKTDTINWADVSGIKLKTDTIDWANVATLLNEIGVGNITAIKTATDTINWGDVTGLVTASGAIQAKTDTINWADVTGIKTATDTINWADVTGIKTATDTINWADVTALGTAVAQVQTDMAKEATLQGALATLAAIQANMATNADLQTALGQLTALQTGLTNLSAQVGTPAQQASLDEAIVTLGQIQGAMATAVDLQAKHDAVMADLSNLSTQLGTPAQEATLTAAYFDLLAWQQLSRQDILDYTFLMWTGLSDQMGTAAQAAALTTAQNTIDQALRDIADVRANMPTGGTDLSAINDKLATLQSTLDAVPTGDVDLTQVTTQLDGVKTTLTAIQDKQLETDTLMAKLDSMDEAVQSAAGASAAVGLSQSAYAAASQAVTILEQLQAEIKANGKGSTLAPMLLGKFGDKMGEIEQAVTVIPGELDTAAVSKQLAQLAAGIQSLASEKGYHFDSLYQMSELQGGDVKTIRNNVTELKALVEIQKSILENKLNEPVVKTWFEAGY